MIVRQSDYDSNQFAAAYFGPPEGSCFFCGAPLVPPFVIWQGKEKLRLHPQCVFDLWMRLAGERRDSGEAPDVGPPRE